MQLRQKVDEEQLPHGKGHDKQKLPF